MKFNKYNDETWDFVKADTKEYTHCLHNYPAMMIPQIARELLNRYGTPNGWVLDPCAPLLAKDSTIYYVVGNRRVKGVTLPTDAFIISAFGKHGFSHKETIVRNIPNKRMPKKNSPTNVAGETDVTMHEENIVVCQRQTG